MRLPPPSAVADRGLDAIRAYFQDLEAGTAIARTCMLVLLGDAEMGKTSLLNGLLNDCTPDPAPAGLDGRTIHLEIKRLPLGAGDSAVEFKCYDLGGQHKSYAAAQQAYVASGADGASPGSALTVTASVVPGSSFTLV